MKKIMLLVSLALTSMSNVSFAVENNGDAYLKDSYGNYVKSGSNLCWHTGYWTPAQAIKECDPDLVPKTSIVSEVESKKVVKPIVEKRTVAADTLFDFNKSVLKPEGEVKIAELIKDIRHMQLEVVVVVGHTDRIGSDSYNNKLSLARANTVKNKLVAAGVEPSRIYVEGKGKKQSTLPVNACPGAKSPKVIACLVPDRRVEIEVIGLTNVNPTK